MQRTKRRLSDALVSLVLEKGYDKVTIQDILDRADVGRSTFYLHYENKEQLMLWGHDHLKTLIVGEGQARIDFRGFFAHLAESHQLARALLAGKSGQAVTQFLVGLLLRSLLRIHPASGEREIRALHALRAEAAAAALVRLMQAWLRQGMPAAPERMARESQALLDRLFAPASA